MEDFYIEVLNLKGVWYQAVLVDFDEDGIIVKFDLKSPTTHKFTYAKSRLPSNGSLSPVLLSAGDDCEVLTEGKNDSEPSGWWPATVKMKKGEFFVVDYKIQDDTKYSDIIPSEKIRIPNKNGPINPDLFHKINFQVPDDLCDLYKNERPYLEFRKVCKAKSIYYDETTRNLSVICDNESDIKKVSILIEMHFKNLRQKLMLMKRTQELAQQIEVI
jgi:hypothetical protein